MPSHTSPILAFDLAFALLAAPILLLVTKFAGGNSLGVPFRLSLWAVTGLTIGIARNDATTMDHWLGLAGLSWWTALAAMLATLTILAVAPLLHFIQEKAGAKRIVQNDTFLEIIALSVPYRLFLIATAAVTEESLYRGFAIGVGGSILGSRTAAVALSLAVFVAADFRWGLAHMLSVLWAASALTALFVVTHDLFACIAAHAAVDLMGLVIVPAVMAYRNGAGSLALHI